MTSSRAGKRVGGLPPLPAVWAGSASRSLKLWEAFVIGLILPEGLKTRFVLKREELNRRLGSGVQQAAGYARVDTATGE